MINSIKQKFAEFKVYNQTVRELKSLSNRELVDLGINRWEIENVAREHSRQTFI